MSPSECWLKTSRHSRNNVAQVSMERTAWASYAPWWEDSTCPSFSQQLWSPTPRGALKGHKSDKGTVNPRPLNHCPLCLKVLAHLRIADSSWSSRPQPNGTFSERPPGLKGLPLSPHNPVLVLHRAQFSYRLTCLLSASLIVSYRRAGNHICFVHGCTPVA